MIGEAGSGGATPQTRAEPEYKWQHHGSLHSRIIDIDPVFKKRTTYWYDQNFNDLLEWKVIMNTNMKDSMFDFSAFYTIELTPDNPLSVKWQQIQDMTKTEWIQAVMSKTEAECVAKYNALVKKANTTGLKDVEQYYSTSYKATLDSWK